MKYVAILLLIAVLSGAQIWISQKGAMWRGFLIPALYLALAAKGIYDSLLVVGPRYQSDYYQAGVLLFPGIWYIIVYFVSYYYKKSKE